MREEGGGRAGGFLAGTEAALAALGQLLEATDSVFLVSEVALASLDLARTSW